MATRFYSRAQNLSVAAQIAAMKQHRPEFVLRWRLGIARWIGPLTPTPLSETYHVEIEFSLQLSPKVRVVSPQLLAQPERRIPHMFNQKFLCLYYPKRREWTREMPIATSIVPWTTLWLFHYEMWHATGSWHGGGIHPPEGKKPKGPRGLGDGFREREERSRPEA